MNALVNLVIGKFGYNFTTNNKSLTFDPLSLPPESEYIKVTLPGINQEIVIGKNLHDWTVETIQSRKYSSHFLILDATFSKLNSKFVNWFKNELGIKHVVSLPPEELSKDLENLNSILDQCLRANLDKNSCIIAIGGGITGDVAGFISSECVNGIDFIFIPTTLASQADTIINKATISYKLLKNVLTGFNSPSLTVCDTQFLQTLPAKDMSFGLSEVIKHALIGSPEFVKYLKSTIQPQLQNWENYPWNDIVFKSLSIKAKLVAKDPHDLNGIHKGVSYGHTLGHVLEGISQSKLRHGETVALGMRLSGQVSNLMGILSKADLETQNEIISNAGLPTQIPFPVNPAFALNMLSRDHISEAGEITLVLLKSLGKFFVYKNIDPKIITKVLKENVT